MEIPIRLAVREGFDPPGSSVRGMVTAARADKVVLTPTAAAILGLVSGKRLRKVDQRTLLDALVEHLSDPDPAAQDVGPLSRADVLGAVVGLAHFALDSGGSWLFVRIPESNQKSADIYAVPVAGEPWHLELKSTAPLSSEVAPGGVLDTCSRVHSQRRAGMDQLQATAAAPPIGAPAVRVIGRSPVGPTVGGRALSVVVLPEGALISRSDTRPPNVDGCPSNKRCVEECLRSHEPAFLTSALGLLWKERDASFGSVSAAMSAARWKPVLAAVHAVCAAEWAGSNSVADEAVIALGERIAALGEEEPRDKGAEILHRVLAGSRGVTSNSARDQAVRLVLDATGAADLTQGRLLEEVHAGLPRARESASLDDMSMAELPTTRTREVSLETNLYGAGGSLRDGSIRLSPRLAAIDLALRAEGEADLLGWAGDALVRRVLPRVIGGDDWSAEQLKPVEVTLSGEGHEGAQVAWVVGRELRPGSTTAWPELADLPAHLRRDLRRVVRDSMRRDDPMPVRDWLHRHRDEIARVTSGRVGDVEEWFMAWEEWVHFFPRPRRRLRGWPWTPWSFDLQESSHGRGGLAWVSFDGRISARW